MLLLVSIIAGAISYASAQFLWYAPFAFGPEYLRSKNKDEDSAVDVVTEPGARFQFFLGIMIPALLMGVALVALKTVTDRIVGTAIGFLVFTAVLGLVLCLPKYVKAIFFKRRPERLVVIQDGALFFGLLGAAFAIIGSTV